ncbi:hypothetical protein [Neoaquamicrobium sediminum]|uniref:Uncharacterized protein n=1 Tax=Neoaquamicrobium sediminum TaxID=1849104 RepID=A0ABV3X2F1_9HYPH
MRYQNGKEIKIGEYVAMPDGITGKVLVSITDDDYNNGRTNPEWGQLTPGILVRTADMSVVHYGMEFDMTANATADR